MWKQNTATASTIQPGDRLHIDVADTLPNLPIKGHYRVEPEGTVSLGAVYGRVQLKGKTMVQAEATLRDYLGRILKDPQVAVARYDPPVEERYQLLEVRVQQLEQDLRMALFAIKQLQKQKGE
jgi:protein involved in polysaccharide export with SLBB domain